LTVREDLLSQDPSDRTCCISSVSKRISKI
jgi:hypothetical protein